MYSKVGLNSNKSTQFISLHKVSMVNKKHKEPKIPSDKAIHVSGGNMCNSKDFDDVY